MRNPALAAMEIAGLGRLHPGRLAVAFGHGVEPWMRQIDARPPDRLAALEETVSAVRALLGGSNVTTDGSFVHLHDVQLRHVPDPPPAILIGTTGPRGAGGGGPLGRRLPARRGQRAAGGALGAVRRPGERGRPSSTPGSASTTIATRPPRRCGRGSRPGAR